MKGLTEGRIVHYTISEADSVEASAGAHRAAIVVYVYPMNDEPHLDGHVDLHVFLRNEDAGGAAKLYKARVEPGEPDEPGTWHWIERA